MIYQATLTGEGEQPLLGRPDSLVRADVLQARDGHPRPDTRRYEVVDAKLARTAKTRAVLQTAFYSRLLAGLQDTEPRWMHLALGQGEFASFRVHDFAAYERQTRRRLAEVVDAGTSTRRGFAALPELPRGLLALPEPADGDLFFDIERARYYSEDGREFGLQYLFGVVGQHRRRCAG